MGLGQVVHLKGSEADFWVLMEENKKTCKGVTRTKVFKSSQIKKILCHNLNHIRGLD